MKIYSKMVFDKDMNMIEEESYEYTGPIAHCGGGGSPPPPPPPPPPPAPPPPPTTYRTTGRALERTTGGRGVLIRPRATLGVTPEPDTLGERKNLLQPTQEITQNLLRLLGGGY